MYLEYSCIFMLLRKIKTRVATRLHGYTSNVAHISHSAVAHLTELMV